MENDLQLRGSFESSPPHTTFREENIQPIAFGVSLNLNLQSQSLWSLLNGTWQKRPGELNYQLRFEIEEMTLQMQ